MANLFNPEKYVTGDLVGVDGNAFAILGYFSKQAKRQGWSKDDIDKVIAEAKTGDYYHLIAVISDHIQYD